MRLDANAPTTFGHSPRDQRSSGGQVVMTWTGSPPNELLLPNERNAEDPGNALVHHNPKGVYVTDPTAGAGVRGTPTRCPGTL